MRPQGPGTALGAVGFHRAADRLARIARARFGRGTVSGAGAAPARDGGVAVRPWAAPVRLAAAAPLLAVAAALLLPAAPAEAQTTYVSNTGQTYDEDERDLVGPFRWEQYSMAQRFRTGGQAGGYSLGSVELSLFGIGNLDVPKVSIHSVNANGNLGGSVHVLTNPGRFVERSFNTFTAPANATLAANTNYAVVVEATDGAFGVGVTRRFAEDSGNASGWTIGDGVYYRYSDSGSWILLTSRALRIAVKEPVPWFSVADAEANEADGYMDFTVKLRRPTADGSPLLIGAEVDYTTVDGTAVAGEDYTHTTGTLTFGEDQEEATVRVPLIDDTVEDDGETFTLVLSNPKRATIADGEATGTIRNTEDLTASFGNVPESHAGSGEFTLRLAFSEALAAGGSGRKIGQALVLSGATRGAILRVDGRRDLYEFTVRPTGNGAVTVSLPATTGACDANDAICTAGGEKLSGAVRAEIAGPDTGQEPQTSLTASFEDVPASHDGSSAFTLRVAFSEAVSTGFRTMRDDAFTVTGGSVTGAKRVDRRSDLWEIRVEPSGSGAVTVSLPATTGACTATGAVCTSEGLKLSGAVSAEIAGPPVTPLTASFSDVPSEHDGSSAFTLRVSFSEALAAGGSGRRIAQALALTGATRNAVRRVDGRYDLYWFQVRPSGNGAVTVSLASTGACGGAAAVCTSDGRALSNVPEATIQGPPSLSVADAEVNEGTGASLAFTVALSRAASGTVTVDYATSDVTATAGEDYTAASGTLTFAAGETEKTVAVAVLDDAHDDDGETLTLTLSNPSGAWLSDATATGTIHNTGLMPKAWLARFGRASAEHVTGAIDERLRSGPDTHVALGGQSLALGGEAEREAIITRLAEQVSHKTGERLLRWEDAAHPVAREVSIPDILLASSFHLASAENMDSGARWSLWGRGTRSSFNGEEDALTLEGDVTTATLGVDFERRNWIIGVALSRSAGDGSYKAGGSCSVMCAGDVESALTGIYPYVRYQMNDDLSAWGVVGHGQGDLTLAHEGKRAMEADIEMSMAAAGARGVVLPARKAGDFELAVRTDLLVTRTSSDASADLVATEAETNRLRLLLEGSRSFRYGENAVITPSVEFGLRYDGGDAETGSGLEVGGSVRYVSGSLTVKVSARGLLAHSESDYEEWGVSGSVRLAPGADGHGLSMRLGSAWGATSGGGERLWSQANGAFGEGSFDPDARLDAEVAYGFDAPRGLLTPYTGVALSEVSESWRAGARWKLGALSEVSLEASLTDSAGNEKPEGGLLLRGSKRW